MYSGLWLFAWDLADEGVDAVMGWAADSGLTALQVAGAYHAGWFLHPHNPRHRAYMAEDGRVYFQPELRRYRDTGLQPLVASICAQTDWMRAAGDRLDRYGLELVSWTVCCHNTRLGLLHPECTARNCYGDSYPHALCPANEKVRAYLTSLCGDLANNLPLHAVQLESPGYMGWAHGHHHERDLTVLSPVERSLMDLCFCESCATQAEAWSIDVTGIRGAVRSILDAAMENAPNRPAGHPETLSQVLERVPGLPAFRGFRHEVEASLIGEIREAMRPSPAQLFLLGSFDSAVAEHVEAFNIGVYGQRPAEVLESTRAAKTGMGPGHALYMGVRLGLSSVADAAELRDTVQAIREGGGQGVMFYNYSESPRRALNWIKPALSGLG